MSVAIARGRADRASWVVRARRCLLRARRQPSGPGEHSNPPVMRRARRQPTRRRMPAPMQRPNWLTRHAATECRGRPLPCHNSAEQRAFRGRARCAQADGVRDPVFVVANSFSAVLPAIEQPRTMSEASSLIVSAKPARCEHVPLGILYMVSATIVFAVSSAVSKWLVASYPVGEVLFTRTSVALLTCALFILPQTGLAVFR